MVLYFYKKALDMLMKKPFLLWGISLISIILTTLANMFCVLPIISIPVTMVIGYGMVMVYLSAVNDEAYSTDQLFLGFKSFKEFKRVFGSLGIKTLWHILWCLIPVVGPVTGIIKGYQYSFVPYIVATDKECTSGEALEQSKQKTKGYKHVMFWCDVLLPVAFGVAAAILGLLAKIPFIGFLFGLVLAVFAILYFLLKPLFKGLVHAYIWKEEEDPQYVAPVKAAPAAPQYPQYPQQPGYPQGYPQQYPQQPYAYAPQQQAYPQQPYTYAPQQADPYQYQPIDQQMYAPEAPAYEAPAYEAPAYEAPAYEAPAYEAPAYEAPIPEAPAYEAPVAEAPAAEVPAPETPTAAFCPNCGAPLAPGAMFCGACGTRLG